MDHKFVIMFYTGLFAGMLFGLIGRKAYRAKKVELSEIVVLGIAVIVNILLFVYL